MAISCATSSGRKRWRRSIPRCSTPAVTSSARAADRTPSTSVESRTSCAAVAVRACVTRLPGHLHVLTDVPLAIDPDEVLRFQGYKKGIDQPTADVRALFDEALTLGRRLIEPRAVVRWRAVDHRDGDRLHVSGVVLDIPDIARNWGPIEH